MVLLWKKPENNSKGIIIFTHKEINNSFIPFNNLKKQYFIGIHIGCWYTKIVPNYVDFVLGSINQIQYKQTVPVIPYNSRNFLPKYFDKIEGKNKESLIKSIKKFKEYSKYPLNNIIENINKNEKEKYWDIITVAKPHHVKKLDLFLREIKKCMQKKEDLKVLIISAIAPNEHAHKNHHHDLEKIIKKDFTVNESNNITLLRPECGTNEGIDNEYIYPFYQWSKVFCFFTEFEGESRVTHEALCCGLAVVCYKNLKGGASEYLDKKNSIQFEKYEEAHKSILECVNNYQKLNNDYLELQEKLREDKSIKLIEEEFRKFYKSKGTVFNDSLIPYDQLHFRLPGHYYYDDWAKFSDNETSDILNIKQWNIFKKIYL